MKKIAAILIGIYIIGALCGCSLLSSERVRLRDLEFTVLSQDKIPQELAAILEERKAEPFKLTYSDQEFLYVCIGYGEQETGGYSIAVDDFYLTDNAIYVSTTLLGPDANLKNDKTPSYPYLVIKTEFLDETVIFE